MRYMNRKHPLYQMAIQDAIEVARKTRIRKPWTTKDKNYNFGCEAVMKNLEKLVEVSDAGGKEVR